MPDILSFAGWTFAAQTLIVLPRCLQLTSPTTLLVLGFVCTGLGRFGLAAASMLPPTPTILASYVVCNFGQASRPSAVRDSFHIRRYLGWQGMTATLLKSLMGNASRPGRRGLQLGLLASCEKIAGIVGPLAAGPLYSSQFGSATPAWAAGLFALAGGCTAAFVSSELRTLEAYAEKDA